jgi:hypothetical protein
VVWTIRVGSISGLDDQGGPYKWFGRLGKEKKVLCLPEIKPRFFCGPARSLITILTELDMIYSIKNCNMLDNVGLTYCLVQLPHQRLSLYVW